MDDSVEDRTVFCGNLCDEVTDAILFELFNQAGPVESVRRPRDPNTRRPKSFGFIIYKHSCSVPYAVELFRGTKLFNKNLNINSRSRTRHVPVLDTHLNDSNVIGSQSSHGHKRSRNDTGYRNKWEKDTQSHRDRGKRTNEDSNSRNERYSEPSSWSALKSQGMSTANGLQSSSSSRTSDLFGPRPNFYGAQIPPDFSALLQLGQQMMIPGMPPPMALPNLMPFTGMELGPRLGAGPDMFPSMQAGYDGGRISPDGHRQYRSDQHGWRDRPYDGRHYHHQHDRRYSYSQSSHDMEKRDRRSR